MKRNLLLKLWVLIIAAGLSASLNAQALLQEVTGTGLPSVGRNYTVAGDYDNDGDLDLLIVSPTFAGIYKNNGSGVFEVGVTFLPNGISNGSCAFGDYNNDGYLDVVIAGDGGTGVGIVTKLYKNNGNGTFTEQKQNSFIGIYYGTVTFVDYNNDGFLDIHIIGRINAVHQRANGNRLYRNNHNGTFSDVGGTKISSGNNSSYQYGSDLFLYQGWPATGTAAWGPHTASDAYAVWGDINNDGYPDLIESGYPDTKTPNFLSNGNGGFNPISALTSASNGGNGLQILQANSSVVLADLDNDGDLDAIVGGSSKKIAIYKNTGTAPNYSFSWYADLVTSASALSLLTNGIAVADFDNDGDLDIALQYNDGATSAAVTKIFKNNGFTASPQFTELTSSEFPLTAGYRWGSCVWGDFNNDGLLDLVLTGQEGTGTTGQIRLFKNTTGASAAATPSAPTTLSQTVGTSDAVLTWNNGNDPVQGSFVTYNLRVGTTSGGSNIVNPSVNSDGKRQLASPGRIPQMYTSPGVAAPTVNYPIKNLAPGTYYWSVQTINNSFRPSAWSTEQSFTITQEQAHDIKITNVAPGSVTISWTKGSNGNTAVFIDTFNVYRVAYGATSPTDKKTDFPVLRMDTTFAANAAFGTPSSKFRRTGWHCVYNGTGNSVTVTGLSRDDIFKYSVAVVDYSGGAGSEKYNLNMAPGNPSLIQPTVNSRNIVASNITSTGLTVTWNNAYVNPSTGATSYYYNANHGYGRAVFIKEGTRDQNLNIPVENDSIYVANAIFGQGSQIKNTGWYCIYNGYSTTATNSVAITGLKSETPYTVRVVEYFSVPGPVKYNNQDTISNPIEISTLSNPLPTTQASNLVFSNVGNNNFDVSWTNGDGVGRIVFISKGSTGAPVLTNYQDYTPNTVFGQGSMASTGWYCVYDGTGSQVSITGLELNVQYRVMVCEYNIYNGKKKYLTDVATDNPLNQTTSNKLQQVIVFDPISNKTLLDAPFTLTATGGDSGNPIVFTSSNTSVATISGNTVTIVGIGTTDITATQAGNSGYSDANSVKRTLTVNKVAQAINFAALPTNIKYLDPAFQVSATGGASGNPVVFTSSDPTKATVSGTTVTIVGAGSVDITATQAGNATYADAEVKQTLVIAKLPQAIGFDNLANKTYLNAPFTLTATGGDSGNPVTFTANSTIVSITGSTCTILGAGTVTITADQAGNSNYSAAPSVPRTLTIAKAAQGITFDILPVKNANDGTITLTATASSGLPVTYTTSDALVASISGNTVTIKKSGTINITAVQAGDANFLAAGNAVRALVVNKLGQTLTFDALETKLPTEADFQLNATVTSGRKITYTSSNPNVATITGDNMDYVHIVGNGTTFITASQPGDSIYLAAVPVQHVFMVGTTGVKEFSEKEVSIFPNPVNETLNVNFAKQMPQTTIGIYSYNGQQVISQNADKPANEIYMGNLAKGTYILKIVSPDGTLVKQIIKK